MTNRKRFFSKELNMQFDAYDDGKIRTADHVEYSPDETKILEGDHITLDLHLLKSVFNGEIILGEENAKKTD